MTEKQKKILMLYDKMKRYFSKKSYIDIDLYEGIDESIHNICDDWVNLVTEILDIDAEECELLYDAVYNGFPFSFTFIDTDTNTQEKITCNTIEELILTFFSDNKKEN